MVTVTLVHLGSQAPFCHLALTVQGKETTRGVGFLSSSLSGLPNNSQLSWKTHETNLTQSSSHLFLLPEMTIDEHCIRLKHLQDSIQENRLSLA